VLCHFRGALGTRLIQCGLRRGLIPYQVASSSIEPFGHNSVGCHSLHRNISTNYYLVVEIHTILEMWANAQRDGRPARYRWRPLFNAAVWLCSNAAKMRNLLKFVEVPQTNKTISAASGPSSPYCKDVWRRYCCLTSFFPIVNMCLSCEDIARQCCAMVRRWRFFASFMLVLLRFQNVSCRSVSVGFAEKTSVFGSV